MDGVVLACAAELSREPALIRRLLQQEEAMDLVSRWVLRRVRRNGGIRLSKASPIQNRELARAAAPEPARELYVFPNSLSTSDRGFGVQSTATQKRRARAPRHQFRPEFVHKTVRLRVSIREDRHRGHTIRDWFFLPKNRAYIASILPAQMSR